MAGRRRLSHCASDSKGHVGRCRQAARGGVATPRQPRQDLRYPSDDLGSLESDLEATVFDLHLLRRLLAVGFD